MESNKPLQRSIDELTKVLDRWPNVEPSSVDQYNMMRSTRDSLQLLADEVQGAYDSFSKILSATMEQFKPTAILTSLDVEEEGGKSDHSKKRDRHGYV